MDPTNRMARAYVRVSTEEQGQSGYSLAAQQERIEQFCKSNGYNTVKVYVDDGLSAKDLNRPAFKRMMAEAQPGDIIVSYKLDRLTRSVRDLYELWTEWEKRNLYYRSVTEQFDTTSPTGRVMMSLVAVFAQWEREMIAERTAFGKQKKASLGEWGGGRPPFGYALEPSERIKGGRQLMQLVPDPKTAHLVIAIFKRYLEGQGVRAIATWLNEELGARSSQGRLFDSVKVGRILQNPMYTGVIQHKGQEVPSSHDPLISRTLYDQVQRTFDARKLVPPRQATGEYVLSGIARCGVCGGAIGVMKMSKRGRQAGQYFYRCKNWETARGCGGKDIPSLTSTPGPLMEQRLVETVAALGEPGRLENYYRALEERHKRDVGLTEAEIERVRADLEETQATIARWDRLYGTGKLEMEDYLNHVGPAKERRMVLREQLEDILSKPAPPSKEALAGIVLTFPSVWADAQPAERKELLRNFVDAFRATVCLYPGQRLEVYPAGEWRPPGLASPESDAI